LLIHVERQLKIVRWRPSRSKNELRRIRGTAQRVRDVPLFFFGHVTEQRRILVYPAPYRRCGVNLKESPVF
jgi:hypothetical protein